MGIECGQVYKCDLCGNIVIVVHAGGGDLGGERGVAHDWEEMRRIRLGRSRNSSRNFTPSPGLNWSSWA